MENTISINRNQMAIREYKGQRVVTFKDIDTVHGRKDGTARKRFNDNRNRFIEGIDYFVRKTDEAKKEFGAIAPNGLTLITESGYLMLAKSFTDDLAWTVQRELVNFYFRGKAPEPEQLTLETSEYHYFPKTLNGKPVITLADFEHFTGINMGSARVALHRHCLQNIDFFLLTKSELRAFKLENHFSYKLMNSLIAITKSGVEKLLRFYECSAEIPMIEEKPVIKPKAKRTAGEILDERKITHDDCIIALDVLRRIERNREYNVKMAEDEGRNPKFYRQDLYEVKNVIKSIGMLMVMGY